MYCKDPYQTKQINRKTFGFYFVKKKKTFGF